MKKLDLIVGLTMLAVVAFYTADTRRISQATAKAATATSRTNEVAAWGAISNQLGVLSPEYVQLLKAGIWSTYADDVLTEIKDLKAGQLQWCAELSAAMDRAAYTALGYFDESGLATFLDCFGDVYINYWVLCRTWTPLSDSDPKGSAFRAMKTDEGSRQFFELMAYCAFHRFKRENRHPRLWASFADEPDLKARMARRKDLLVEKHTAFARGLRMPA